MFKITARTVLELGSELISKDIIAFYELIKNAFDAGSASGADIHFQVVLRRNEYLSIRAKAEAALKKGKTKAERSAASFELLPKLIDEVTSQLSSDAHPDLISGFRDAITKISSLEEFLLKLEEAYVNFNTITVSDTGVGMSAEELQTNFLTIGTASRKKLVEAAVSLGQRSPYLGEKGIGRLSAMRLGNQLHILTAKKDDTHYNALDIDWRRFDDLDAMVGDIDIKPTKAGKKAVSNWSGTKLEIGGLAEDWTEGKVRQLADYDFARITDPFVDPGKRPRIAIFWNGTRIAIPWMEKLLLENAHGTMEGKYIRTDNGPELHVTLEAINLGYEHPREKETTIYTLPELEGLFVGPTQKILPAALIDLGPFEFKAYWYNRRTLTGIESIGNQKAVRDLQKKWSGILLFRDGFRVFPYGEDEDDWLGLDRKALGRTAYILNKQQFVGHVQISRSENPRLLDQTNREGLRVSPEQELFVAVLQHVVREMLWEFFKNMDRRYKKLPLDLGDVKAEIRTLDSRASSALAKVRRLVPKDQTEVVDDLQHAFIEFRDLSAKAQRRIEEVEADSRQMVHMAGVGLMVEVIAHELTRATESALKAIEGLKGKDIPEGVRSRLDTLRAEMKSVSKRLRILDQLSVSGRQRAESFDLSELLEDLKDGHKAQFERHNIDMVVRGVGSPIRVKLVKGMIVQILENLISNSMYWMSVKKLRNPHYKPRISIRIETDPLVIYFADNGPGIAADHREKIFRPFWSLKEKSKRRGLGLFIARENAEFLDGRLTLSEKTDVKTGRLYEFVLELPDGGA